MRSIKLGDILNPGSVVRTRHYEGNSWVSNVIYSISEDSLELDMGLEMEYIKNLIMVGDTMKCKFTTGSSEYSILGWISRISTNPASVTMRVHQIDEFPNNRDSCRFDVYLSTVIKSHLEDEKGIFAILTNISRTGIAFVVREDIEKLLSIEENLQSITLFFQVNISAGITLDFQGIIMRKILQEKRIEYGVKVLEMDIRNEKILDAFLIELASIDSDLFNKRSSFWSKNSKLNKE